MAPKIEWPDFSTLETPLEQLAALSRYYGGDPDFVLAGGGNTSVKSHDRLHVKASGVEMAVIGTDGFVELDRAPLDALLSSLKDETDPVRRESGFKDAVMAARVHPERGQRPSVECVLHNLLPGRFVVHTHPGLINMITCTRGGEALARELFGDTILWIPYTTPGFVLARTLDEELRAYTARTGKPWPDAVLMGNHGLILCADTPDEIRRVTNDLCEKVRAKAGTLSEEPFGPITLLNAESARTQVRRIAPALRALLADGPVRKVVQFDDAPVFTALAGSTLGRELAQGGALTPDQIVYCKSLPMTFAPIEDEEETATVERLRAAVESYRQEHGFPPILVLADGLGLFASGTSAKAAATARALYADAVSIMAGAQKLGGVLPMTFEDRRFIENWEVESYRRSVAAAGATRGRVEGKVAVVTGAAQGFGLEIAQHLAAEGANVVLADLNAAGAEAAAASLSEKHGPGRALGLAMNVTDAASIRQAIDAAVRAFGGFDVFISNAGVLKAESVKTQTLADFDFVTRVNYTGYFLCVQEAVPVLATQHRARPGEWTDIIQINSKSGLAGSNRNGAYAGSKFGGIGLTQSFALELVEDGIKVNAICPGNFFDGPLWSDPQNGLFAQYLRTGKVPGAKTIEDVRRSYEERVPMKRGCTTPDVMAAIYYILEQRYETGQAIPVTGGQTMLS